MVWDCLEGDPSSKCVIWCRGLVFVLWAQEDSAHKSHSWKILAATNWQRTQTIASQPSQLILIHPMHGLGFSRRGSKCVIWCRGLVFVLWAQKDSAHKSHSWKIFEATNWQKTQTIASQPSQLILIHPMHGLGLSRRGSKFMIWYRGLVFVLWAWGKFRSQIHLLENFGGYQLTKDPNNCFPTITIDLDTSNAWFV
jgi:hypothetical protein